MNKNLIEGECEKEDIYIKFSMAKSGRAKLTLLKKDENGK